MGIIQTINSVELNAARRERRERGDREEERRKCERLREKDGETCIKRGV